MVAFVQTEVLVGETAVSKAHKNATNTVPRWFTLLGRAAGDAAVQQVSKEVAYDIAEATSGKGVQINVVQDDV